MAHSVRHLRHHMSLGGLARAARPGLLPADFSQRSSQNRSFTRLAHMAPGLGTCPVSPVGATPLLSLPGPASSLLPLWPRLYLPPHDSWGLPQDPSPGCRLCPNRAPSTPRSLAPPSGPSSMPSSDGGPAEGPDSSLHPPLSSPLPGLPSLPDRLSFLSEPKCSLTD